MGEFVEIANALATAIGEGEPIESDLVVEIIRKSAGGGDFNCYPGNPGYDCCVLAVFVSMCDESLTVGKGHMNFRRMFQKFKEHMRGQCQGQTKNAVMITDSWSPGEFNKWRDVIGQVQKEGVRVEIYIIVKDKVSEISF